MPAYTNPHKKSHPTKKALTVPKPDYPVLLRRKDRIKTYSATNGPGSVYKYGPLTCEPVAIKIRQEIVISRLNCRLLLIFYFN